MLAISGDLSDAGLARLTADMDLATLAIARRHDPRPRKDLWGRPLGWGNLNLTFAPTLGIEYKTPETAQEINALRAFAKGPIPAARPFILKAGGEDAARAQRCLAQAVYYEAAREPLEGQRAVAQGVLNRLRHPAYPKSVCGVVYQGSARITGCQFTFTCDGALAYAPEPSLWARAQAVARAALAGFVARPVGTATHYHADYVAPYWAPTLVKLNQIGAHIFYRWTGPGGLPGAFTGKYAGNEAYLSPTVLGSTDARTQGLRLAAGRLSPEQQGLGGGRTVTLAVAGEVRTYTVADPGAADGERTRVLGTLTPSRRAPTPDEVRQINEALAGIDGGAATEDAGPDMPPPSE
jgi:spore germination cell wall hydrolase CwlJ-like protein